jgi:hypothetical protein
VRSCRCQRKKIRKKKKERIYPDGSTAYHKYYIRTTGGIPMNRGIIIVLVASFLFILGQTTFSHKQASSSDEAVALSWDMTRKGKERYLIDQAKRFLRQGRYADALDLSLYMREKLDLESPETASIADRSRRELEESAMSEAEKLQDQVNAFADLK